MAISALILGRRMKNARQKKRYTQEYVAEQIDLSVSHLSKIERGLKPIYLDKLSELCDLLDVPIEEILTGAVIPQNAQYNQQFGEIAKMCSPETVEVMLDVCGRIAQVERSAAKREE